MISIRKASEEQDRLEALATAAKVSYVNAVKAAAQYTVELDAAETRLFREHMDQIRAEAERAAYPHDWPSIQTSFRGELREQRDRSLAQLAKLRAEMKAAAEAMQMFAESVAESGADHHEDVHTALKTLDTAAKKDGIDELRAVVAQTGTVIRASMERMERAHALVIAQLQDEIRLLHGKIAAEHRALFLDATGVWNREKLDAQLQEMLEAEDSFCVLVVCVRNLKRLDQRYSPAALQAGVKSLLQRLATLIGDRAIVGRWDEETFAAILCVEPATAIAISRDAARRLSGTYTVQEHGASRSIELQAAAGVIDRGAGTDANAFWQKLLQMSVALRGA